MYCIIKAELRAQLGHGCRLLIKFNISDLLLAMFASADHVPVKEP